MADEIRLLVVLIAAAVAAYMYFVKFAPDTESKAKKARSPSVTQGEKKVKQTKQKAPPPKQQQQQQQPKKKKQSRPAKPSSNPRYVRRFGGHHGNILAVRPSPSGEWTATAGADGLLRVTRSEKEKGGGADVYLQTKIEDDDGVPDKVVALSWEADGRTVACALDRSSEVRFYRMRKKKDAAGEESGATAAAATAHAGSAYELADLTKRRFSTASKLGDITACEADCSSDRFSLVLTSGDSKTHKGQKTTVAWDGKTGHALSEMTTGGGDIRLSQDGKFLCGRSMGKTDQVKIFEVLRKKVKGDVEPHFDRISPGKVMTLVAKVKVQDMAFGYTDRVCDKAFVFGVDGTVQVWNLDVEYRAGADPKMLCSMDFGKKISMAASSFEGDHVSIVTFDGSIHLLKFTSEPKPSISAYDTIENCHPDGVGDVRFCSSGSQVCTRGAVSKDVFLWRA